MGLSFWQIGLVVLLAVLLFGGRGRISSIMGDLAKGITSFRKGLKEDTEAEAKALRDDGVTIDSAAESAKDKSQV